MLDLFNKYPKNKDGSEVERLSAFLTEKGIVFQSIRCEISPSVILYEIVPTTQTRFSEILRLKNDIALLLRTDYIVITPSYRNKGTIAIQVKNNHSYILGAGEIIEEQDIGISSAKLPIVLGTDIENKAIIADLTQMPHLLIAGATGQGKSVSIHTIISGLIWHKKPAEVKFVLIDPKLVEFSVYNTLQGYHFLETDISGKPIITTLNDVQRILDLLIAEMNNRYFLLESGGKRKISEIEKPPPYIVVIIDEFAEILLNKKLNIEQKIILLAQKSRAVGIHLILSTQRPSAKVISSEIKANFPARIAFKCVSRGDSQTILGYSGAEKLFGDGDGLFLYNARITRFRGAYITGEETIKLIQYINNRNTVPANLISETEETENIIEETEDVMTTIEDVELEDVPLPLDDKEEPKITQTGNTPIYYENKIDELNLISIINSKFQEVNKIQHIQFKYFPVWRVSLYDIAQNREESFYFHFKLQDVILIDHEKLILKPLSAFDYTHSQRFDLGNIKQLDENKAGFYDVYNHYYNGFNINDLGFLSKKRPGIKIKSMDKHLLPYWECSIVLKGKFQPEKVFIDGLWGLEMEGNPIE